MPGKAYVTVSADVLNIDTVWSVLVWVENFAELTLPAGGYGQLRAQLSQENQVQIVADEYNSDHHFGPVLTLKGTRHKDELESKFATEEQSVEIVVPWHKVLSVVRDNNGKFKPGFRAGEPKDVPPPEEEQ